MATSKGQVLAISGKGVFGKVANYSALPAANLHEGETWICLASQGTAWIGGLWGGTFYDKGQYYSDGTDWIYDSTPYQASQSAVNAGLIDDQFVSPLKLANLAKWLEYVKKDEGAIIKSHFNTTTIYDHAPNTIAANEVFSSMIPAGTLKGGDVFRVQFKLLRLSGTGSAFIRIYNTTSAGSLGNRIAQNSSTTGGATQVVTRNFRIAPDGLSMTFVSGAIAFSSDEVVNTNLSNETLYSFDVNQDQYFKIGIEMSVATDVYRLYYVYSQIIRP